MKQPSTYLLSFNRLAVGFGCLLMLLSWGYPAASAAKRAPDSYSPGPDRSGGNTSGSSGPAPAQAIAGAALRRLASPTAIVYTWAAPGASASWSAPGSWTPARTTPDPSDILLFTSGSAAPTVLIDFAASQTIGGLFISTGNAVTFSTDGTDGTNIGFGRTLTITNGSAGADLALSSSSTLTVYNFSTYSANTGLILALGTGATATIGGRLIFDSAVANTNTPATSHTLQGNGAASIEFAAGSIFTTQATFRGNPFGSGAALANSVVFRNGSRYEYTAGNNPFVLAQPATITTFEPTSTFYFAPASSGTPALTGRTYGHFEYNNPGGSSSPAGASAVTIAGNLVLTAGTLNINLTGSTILKGNVLLNGGSLSFNPGSVATVQFAGTTAQIIGGTASGSPAFNTNATVQLNNAAGLTLRQPLTVPGTLQLTSGLLTTSTSNVLTLAAGATVSGGSDNSFVNGPVARPVPATSNASGTFTSYLFPVGKGTAYRPLTLSINTQGNALTYRAEQFEGNPGQMGTDPAAANGTALTRVSRVHSFTVTPFSGGTVTQPTGFQGTITLSFNSDDQVTNATALTIAKRTDNTQPWTSLGIGGSTVSGTSGGYQSGTLTSNAFTTFSDFALASTDANPANNPLPVQLVSFAASRSARGGVALTWATASELRSSHFEVERSLDGHTFGRAATVAALGSSATARTYAALDAQAPASALYYRLRAVDADGTTAYSPTVPLAAVALLEAYPNPTTGLLIIAGASGRYAVLRDLLGRVVRSATLPDSGQLSLVGLAPGTYLLAVDGIPPRRISKVE